MAVEKVANNRDQIPHLLSRTSVRSRCFHLYNHSKTSLTVACKRTPSILKQKRMRFTESRPLKQITLTVNIIEDEEISKTFMSSNILDDNKLAPSSSSKFINKIELVNKREENFQRNSVRFHSKVLVKRIPSRKQYPESIKRSIWSSLSEIRKSAARNTIEFQSEGCDWRYAIEENCMYYHPKSGQYIHPIHVKMAFSSASTLHVDNKKEETTVQNVEPEKSFPLAKVSVPYTADTSFETTKQQ